MKRLMLFLAAGILFTSAAAQDRPLGPPGSTAVESRQKGDLPAEMSAQTAMSAGKRSSPFPTPTPTDTLFVIDEGPGLDTGCQFRSAGSLKFTVSIKRHVGEVASDGRLLSPQTLVSNGVISPTVTIRMPAYDVDYGTQPPKPYLPERDRIYFNGHPVGDLGSNAFLFGENNKWRMNEITVPIEYVRFAPRGADGQEPATAGKNEIEILIDQANLESGTDVWCTAIDWAAISFKALAPVIMVHGNGESGAFWDRLNFTRPFRQAGAPYDSTINLPTTFIAENAATLGNEVPRRAREFGVKHVHLVAHSKGGLDSRAFLKRLPAEGQLAVLSLTTLSTPHHGSAAADYVRDALGASWWHSEDSVRTKAVQWKGGDYDDGRKNLTTEFVTKRFNPENLPLPRNFRVDGEQTDVKYFSYGAEANIDNSFSLLGNPTIQENEIAGTGHEGELGNEEGFNLTYRLLYYVAATYSDRRYVNGEWKRIVRETPNQEPQRNDFLVTVKSSKLPGHFQERPELLRNHATIGNEGIGRIVLDLIRSIQPVQ